MELQGKKVVFLGDSITEGKGTTDIEHRYTNVFARRIASVECGRGENRGIVVSIFTKFINVLLPVAFATGKKPI